MGRVYPITGGANSGKGEMDCVAAGIVAVVFHKGLLKARSLPHEHYKRQGKNSRGFIRALTQRRRHDTYTHLAAQDVNSIKIDNCHCSCFMPVARLVALQASLCQPPVRAPWRVCCLRSAAQSSTNKSTPACLAVSALKHHRNAEARSSKGRRIARSAPSSRRQSAATSLVLAPR